MTLHPARSHLRRAARRVETQPGAHPQPGDLRSALPASLRLARPGQWPKNLIVAAVPAAAGVLDERAVLVHTLLLVVAFIAASAAVYCLNDVRDAVADRLHPVKRTDRSPAASVPRAGP